MMHLYMDVLFLLRPKIFYILKKNIIMTGGLGDWLKKELN